MQASTNDNTIIVVGGGLAGLTAAGDFRLNLGPHALYNGDAAARTLDELGIPRTGGSGGGVTVST